MSDDLQNMNDLIEELEGIMIKTSQGEFVKMEDVRRLVDKRKSAKAITETENKPEPKTVEEARARAKEFLAKEQRGLSPVPNIGKAIPASDNAQPPSRA